MPFSPSPTWRPRRLPRVVAGDLGCVGALSEDQQRVVQGVGVEAGGDREPALPVLPGAQRGDLLGEPLMERGELVGAGGVGLGSLVSAETRGR